LLKPEAPNRRFSTPITASSPSFDWHYRLEPHLMLRWPIGALLSFERMLHVIYATCTALHLPCHVVIGVVVVISLSYVDSSGTGRVTGGKDLKTSQHYPLKFGHGVAGCYMKNKWVVTACAKANMSKLAKLVLNLVYIYIYIYIYGNCILFCLSCEVCQLCMSACEHDCR
jgi:hypothetical protein